MRLYAKTAWCREKKSNENRRRTMPAPGGKSGSIIV